MLAKLLGEHNEIFSYGLMSFISANVINNIPMSVLFSKILSYSSELGVGGIYATVIGSNIGAFLTPVGALAGIMWSNLLRKNGVKISFESRKEWVHLRRSNTEPIIRIYAEAATQEAADALAQQIIDIANKIIG